MNITELVLEGWTEQDYLNACNDELFYKKVEINLDADPMAKSIEKRVSAKYMVAGASARWMFSLNTHEVVKDIKRFVPSINKIDFVSKSVGDRDALAVNHLYTVMEGSYSLVSQFVACEIEKIYSSIVPITNND